MAGISSTPYRILARRFGAAVVYTEMISSHGITYGNLRTMAMIDFSPEERPIGIQLFGANPEIMYKAAQLVSIKNPDLIDLNFGCPAKKVVRKNGGAAVLKDLGLTRALVEAAVAGSSRPVTVKLRSGWDEYTKVYIEAGKTCEAGGASAVTLHARTRASQFSGQACWDDIRRLKEEVSVPVIGNGDITNGADARRMLDQTGCDAVMVGRAALGNPWVFREISQFLASGQSPAPPTLEERMNGILEHAHLLIPSAGELQAMRQMRKHVAWYVRGFEGSSAFRRRMNEIETMADLERLIRSFCCPPA